MEIIRPIVNTLRIFICRIILVTLCHYIKPKMIHSIPHNSVNNCRVNWFAADKSFQNISLFTLNRCCFFFHYFICCPDSSLSFQFFYYLLLFSTTTLLQFCYSILFALSFYVLLIFFSSFILFLCGFCVKWFLAPLNIKCSSFRSFLLL